MLEQVNYMYLYIQNLHPGRNAPAILIFLKYIFARRRNTILQTYIFQSRIANYQLHDLGKFLDLSLNLITCRVGDTYPPHWAEPMK